MATATEAEVSLDDRIRTVVRTVAATGGTRQVTR
ncbi:MAG: hypothetical protein RJB12_1195, partial [Pseudomonadota bacterium]